MDRKSVIVFIDSFPYSCIGQTEFLSSWKGNIVKVKPGFGYSINVKAEIFGGYTPDKAGYLNELSYSMISRLQKYSFFLQALRPVKRFYYLDRITHKIFSRLFHFDAKNIPFEYLRFFEKSGTEAYRDEFNLPTIFSHMNNLKKVCYYHYPYSKKRDYFIFRDSLQVISSGRYDNLFVASGDLDSITHNYGVGSREHIARIVELDDYLSRLYDAFQSRVENGCFIIVSDHGMANVSASVHVNMEREFGKATEYSYLYFIDSTMLRVWAFDERKKVEIEEYLSGLTSGRILSVQERINYGITSKTFGDMIFLLNEGLVFSPSFMGRKVAKAMHGYRPELQSQKGILFSNNHIQRAEYSAVELFRLFMEKLNLD